VRVESSDTNLIPRGLGTHGSRNTFIAGNAVAGPGRKLRARLLEIAGELLDASPTRSPPQMAKCSCATPPSER
jgi:CO/xanthine dehydrogenase Mo-binding subunit